MNSSLLKFCQFSLSSLILSSIFLTTLVNLFIKASTSSFTVPSFLTIETSSLSIAYVIDLSESEVSKSVQQTVPNILLTCSIFSSLLILISFVMGGGMKHGRMTALFNVLLVITHHWD